MERKDTTFQTGPLWYWCVVPVRVFQPTFIDHDMKHLGIKAGICVLSTVQQGNSFWAAILKQMRVGVSFKQNSKISTEQPEIKHLRADKSVF